MLLPSALPCDMRRPPAQTRANANRLFSSPVPDGNGILGTCRSLQSLLNGSPASGSRRAKPEHHSRLQSPLQMRISRPPHHHNHNHNHNHYTSISSFASTASCSSVSSSIAPSHRVLRSRSTTPRLFPRGANKRTRAAYESDSDYYDDSSASDNPQRTRAGDRFSTPKRRRYFPYDMPLGLAESDFFSMRSPPISQSPPTPRNYMDASISAPATAAESDLTCPSLGPEPRAGPAVELAAEVSPWTAQDDQRLVELVLDKFQLSKRDWDECARLMGKDNASVGRRWQLLVGEGNVGLRRGRRRAHGRINGAALR